MTARHCPARESGLDAGLRSRFDSPSRDFSPTPLWWWSGEEVTAERLDWQLRRFAEGGVYNLVLINLAPAGPQFGAETDSPRWFSDTWWERVELACERAGELGMRLWLYDQIGFSGANVQGRVSRDHPWVTGRSLRSRIICADPSRPPLLAPNESLIGVYDRAGRPLAVGGDATAARAPMDLQIVTTVPSAFDYCDPDAVALLLDEVHGEFERRLPQYLGTVIAGTFQDELPATNSWTPRFLEEFAARKGYELGPRLTALFGPASVEAMKIRADYYDVRAALTEEALFVPLREWHERHGMLLGADQSNPARAGFPIQSTQIYSDYPRTHRHVSAVGSDHEGDAKFPASLAKLYGHERVWIEAFHSSGWGGTPEETWDWLLPFLRRGGNLYNPHASYFSTVGGWFEWAPPSTDWRQPYWSHYKQFADAVSRVASVMTWGNADADVAVLHPTATMQASIPLDIPLDHYVDVSFEDAGTDVARTQQVYLELVGKDDWFHFLPSALDEAGVAFDIVDEATVARLGGAGDAERPELAWRTILVPSSPFLPEATARALIKRLDAGGRVVVIGEAPRYASGRDGDDSIVDALGRDPRVQRVADARAAIAVIGDPARNQHVWCDAPLLVRRQGDAGVALLGGAYPNATAQPLRPVIGQARVEDYDFDRTRYRDEWDVGVAAHVAVAEMWNPATGSREPVAVEPGADGGSVLRVRTGGAPLVLLAWQEGVEPSAAGAPERDTGSAATVQVDLTDDWRGELVPTLDNRWGDFARPAGRPLDRLQLWTLEHREDRGDWAPVWATSGQRARALTRDAGQTPAPLTPAECASVVRGSLALADKAWETIEWSASRGRRRDHSGILGAKGRVPSEFVVTQGAWPGATSTVRTILVTEHRGDADLVIISSAGVEAWWNGKKLQLPEGRTRPARVDIRHRRNVLEYRVSAGSASLASEAATATGFALYPPGGYDDRPEFIGVDSSDGVGPETVIFSAHRDVGPDVASALLVVGCARACTVRVNGEVVARHEKVEYYESTWAAIPKFFTHDVTAALRASAGAADVEIDVEGATAADVLWADLAIRFGDGSTATLVSDDSWRCLRRGVTGGVRVVAGVEAQHEAAYAISRPHPLPGADWLRGAPERGASSIAFEATDAVVPRSQAFRVLLPSGARRVEIPAAGVRQAAIDGERVEVDGGQIVLPVPLAAPALLEFEAPATNVARRGAALAGPIEVTHEPSPIELGDWRELGLGAWSGGVRYSRSVEVAGTEAWTLELGGLRGTVEVTVDGERVGSAFCAPFRFEIPGGEGPRELSITVFNTLGPFLSESTSTTWVLPAQLPSGLFGPVCGRIADLRPPVEEAGHLPVVNAQDRPVS